MIEVQMQELTKAIHRLCDLIESKQLQLPLTTPPAPEPAPTPEPKVEKKGKAKPEPKAEPAPAPAPEPKAEPAPAPEPKAEPTPAVDDAGAGAETGGLVTLTDLRGVGRMVLKNGKASEMRDLIAKHEAESLTTLDPKHYASVLEGLKKLASSDV